jgi:ubiquinone biosynthesis protein UbiJ
MVTTRAEDGRAFWVLLVYRLPRDPSTPRIAVWRRLKRLGAAQLLDGLVALPFDARNKEQLEWVAGQVTEAGGQASIWMGQVASRSDERAIVNSLARTIAEEYRAVILEARSARAADDVARRRTIARLRRELRRIRYRDYFPPPEADEARREVDELASLVEANQ